MTGAKSSLDAMCELGGERLTKGATQGVDLGFGGLAGGGPDEPPRVTGARRKGGNARGKGGQGAGRARGRIAQGGELSPGQRIDHRRDEIGLGWKIAVDRAGGEEARAAIAVICTAVIPPSAASAVAESRIACSRAA